MAQGPRCESKRNATAMHDPGKSDGLVVPRKLPNAAVPTLEAVEGVEGRSLAKGNSPPRPRVRTQSRAALYEARRRIRQAAGERKRERFTALWHHVCAPERLEECYYGLNRQAAAGIDGVTWKQYGSGLEGNLQDLSQRLRRGAYKAPPVERTYIPKADGRQRPIGKPTVEDKIVQRSFVEVVGAVYEADFKGFSYGCRPGRGPHDALDALSVATVWRKVNWVLDADLRGFFDAIDHEWLLKFLQHRIGDKRVLRQARKWLKAGVMEEGRRTVVEEGTPQGGSVSPLLANIYLHYVFDLWADRWRRRTARGEVIVVRYLDDFVVGFQYRQDAERFLAEVRQRLSAFGLELHPEKTRLIEFGRFAATNRRKRGEGKPETFNFLGFTHICSTSRAGKYIVLRQTIRARRVAKLKEVRVELQRRRHHNVHQTGPWLGLVLRGHYQYYGVPGNYPALAGFRFQVTWLWLRSLRRRSQKGKYTWRRMHRLARRWIPMPQVTHPYPHQRLRVTTRGGSPVR